MEGGWGGSLVQWSPSNIVGNHEKANTQEIHLFTFIKKYLPEYSFDF